MIRAARSFADAALDLTVIGSYTNIGYELRSRCWRGRELPRMDGRVVAVTGATSGLGEAAAEGFARLGASVWLVGRDRGRLEGARGRLLVGTDNHGLRVGVCDLASLDSVREFAERFGRESPRLDALVNNAGVMTRERSCSPDGIELTLATNVVGPFLLTRLLISSLLASAPACVINVSSGGMYTQRLQVEDLQSTREEFRGSVAYARSKRMQVILSELWARELTGSGVSVHAMHPGWVDTPGLRRSLPGFQRGLRPLLRTPEQGADTILWLGCATSARRRSGAFWLDRVARPTHLLPWTRETRAERERLWAEVGRLAGAGG